MDNKNKHENHSSDLFKKLSADFSIGAENPERLKCIEKLYGYEAMEHAYNAQFFIQFNYQIKYEIILDFIKSGDVITYRKMDQLISLSSKSDQERKIKKLMVVASIVGLRFHCGANRLATFMAPFTEEANKDDELKDIFCGFAAQPFVNFDIADDAADPDHINEQCPNRFLEECLNVWLQHFPDHLTIDVYNNIQQTGTLTFLLSSNREVEQMYSSLGDPEKFNSVGWFYDYSHDVPNVQALHDTIFRKKSDRKKYIDKLYSEYSQIHDYLYVADADFSFFPDQYHHLSKARSNPVFIYAFCMNLLAGEKDNLTSEERGKLITIINQFVDVHSARFGDGGVKKIDRAFC